MSKITEERSVFRINKSLKVSEEVRAESIGASGPSRYADYFYCRA